MPTPSPASLTRRRLTANGKGYPPSQTSATEDFSNLGPVFGVYARVILGLRRKFLATRIYFLSSAAI
jgi:hypothetical protein